MRPHVPGSLPAACMLFSPLHQAWLIPVAHMDMYVFRKVHCRGSSKVCGQCEGVLLNGLHLLATTASWYMVPVVGEGVGGGGGGGGGKRFGYYHIFGKHVEVHGNAIPRGISH